MLVSGTRSYIYRNLWTMRSTGTSKKLKKFTIFTSVCFAMAGAGFANTPQTHDVPAFHNDDGLGLLQDCTFMKARADRTITDVPTTVAGRSVGCISSIKSVVQVLYNLQGSETTSASCLPSDELDWLEVLEHLVLFMESQPKESLSEKTYGVWIMQSLYEKYPCEK